MTERHPYSDACQCERCIEDRPTVARARADVFSFPEKRKRLTPKQEEKRQALVAEYVRVSDAAMRGAGTTPHTARRLKRLRDAIDKLGGFLP